MKIYRIKLDVNNYRSLLAMAGQQKRLSLGGESKRAEWNEPLETSFDSSSSQKPMPDIVSCGAGNMLLWGKSLEILGPAFENCAELLPVFWDGGEGRLVNVLGYANCLDEEHTVWSIHKKSGRKVWINEFAFIPENVPNACAFKVEAAAFTSLCADFEDGSQNLPALVRLADFSGLKLELLWQAR